MKDKNTTHMRVYADDKIKIKDLALELSNVQRDRISEPEALRRALRTANKDLLLNDAEMKRRLKKL
jgi:hypothetical protein